jgi:hypothetical protein
MYIALGGKLGIIELRELGFSTAVFVFIKHNGIKHTVSH